MNCWETLPTESLEYLNCHNTRIGRLSVTHSQSQRSCQGDTQVITSQAKCPCLDTPLYVRRGLMKLNEPGSRWSTKSSVMIYPRLEKETLRKLWRVWFCCCYFVVFCCFFVVVVLLLRGPSLLHNDNNHNFYIALYPCIRAHSAVHYQKYTDSTKKKFGQKYRENTIPKKSVQWTNTSHYAYMQPTYQKSCFLSLFIFRGRSTRELHPAGWPILFCGPTQERKNWERFWKNAGEWTRRVEINKEEIPGSKRSMHANILTYSRF